MVSSQAPAPILCDSCGQRASPEHIRMRLARLELATRYRPVHIALLLVCTAPPASIDDDLYAWGRQKASREAAEYLEGLLQSVGIGTDRSPVERLDEFQRKGIYLARLAECALAPDAKLEDVVSRLAGVLVKRITQSYKPARIALLAPVVPDLAETLREAGLGEKLIAGGQGIEVPSPGDGAGIRGLRLLFESPPS